MYMTDVGDLLAHWKTHPPVHVVLSGLLSGMSTEAAPTTTADEARAFVEQFHLRNQA